MSQDREKYLYFTVGLLKNSTTLDALWQDALKYHMIDQPGKLIALRLTEHYDMLTQGNSHPGATIPMSILPKANGNGHTASKGSMLAANSTDSNGADYDDEVIVTASPDAEQNADEAAEYWANL